jgi:zinc transporter ZupT
LVGALTGIATVPYVHSVDFRTALRGEVVDSTAGFIPGARIAILGTGISAPAESDFDIQGIPHGMFRVRATAPGYSPVERWVEMASDVTFMPTLKLHRVPSAVK